MDKQRYEREIEEILKKYDERTGRTERPRDEQRPFPPPTRPGLPPRNRGVPNRPSYQAPNWRRFSAGQYMLAAFALAVLSWFVRPFSPTVSTLMALAAVVLFILPIILSFTSRGVGTNEQKRWRGQVIDMTTRRDITNDPFAAIKRWFRRRGP